MNKESGENLTPTMPPRQTISIPEHQKDNLKGIKNYKVNQLAMASGAVGDVFQCIHRET